MKKYGLAAIILVLAACDPDLNIVTKGGDGGLEAGPGSVKPAPIGDAASPSDLDGGNGDGGPISEEDSGSPTGHKIDGTNDFAPNEKFLTTSSSGDVYEGFIAWDAQRLYFGMSGKDVGSNSNNKWVLVYLGVPGVTGTKTGIEYGGVQQPTLPFDATHQLRWKTSGALSSVEIFESGAWKAASVALVPLVVQQQGNFMEMSITRASIGATGKLAVHMNMLIENGNDWTYAGVPSTSFTDDKDPNFGKYFEFDLTDTSKAPNAYAPK